MVVGLDIYIAWCVCRIMAMALIKVHQPKALHLKGNVVGAYAHTLLGLPV